MNLKLRRKKLWLTAAAALLGTTVGTCQVTVQNAFTDSVRLTVLSLLNPSNFGF